MKASDSLPPHTGTQVPAVDTDGKQTVASSAPDGERSDEHGRVFARFPWMRMWLLVLLLSGIGIGGEETIWRSYGLRPSVGNSTELWRFWRDRVYEVDGNIVVLVGASRMQTAFRPQSLFERIPDTRLVQLAVYAGGSPIGTLLDLADDSEFRGVVICDLIAPPGSKRSRTVHNSPVGRTSASQGAVRLVRTIHS